MGSKFVEGRSVEFSKSYEESSPSTPIFFILSPGVDPLKDVETLGRCRPKPRGVTAPPHQRPLRPLQMGRGWRAAVSGLRRVLWNQRGQHRADVLKGPESCTLRRNLDSDVSYACLIAAETRGAVDFPASGPRASAFVSRLPPSFSRFSFL